MRVILGECFNSSLKFGLLIYLRGCSKKKYEYYATDPSSHMYGGYSLLIKSITKLIVFPLYKRDYFRLFREFWGYSL